MKKLFLVFFFLFLLSAVNAESKDSVVYISPMDRNEITVWNYEEDAVEILKFPDEKVVRRMIVSQNEDTLYFESQDKENRRCDLVAYDLKKRIIIGRIPLSQYGIVQVAFMEINHPNHELWFSAYDDVTGLPGEWNYLAVVDLKNFALKEVISSKLVFQGMGFSKNYKKVYIAAFQNYDDPDLFWNTVEVYSAENYQHLKSIEVGEKQSAPSDVVEGKKDHLIVSNRLTGELTLIDSKTDEVTIKVRGPYNVVYLAVDNSRDYLFVPSTLAAPKGIWIYNSDTLDYMTNISRPDNYAYFAHMAVDRKNKYLIHSARYYVSGTYEKKIELINLDNFEVEKILPMEAAVWCYICVPGK